jgi:hypothetical protein
MFQDISVLLVWSTGSDAAIEHMVVIEQISVKRSDVALSIES